MLNMDSKKNSFGFLTVCNMTYRVAARECVSCIQPLSGDDKFSSKYRNGLKLRS